MHSLLEYAGICDHWLSAERVPEMCCSGAGMDEFGVSFDVDQALALDDEALDSDDAAGPYQPGTLAKFAYFAHTIHITTSFG